MNERPTPETDKAASEPGMYGNIVAVDFARRLERQRDELREALEKCAEVIGPINKETWATDDETNDAYDSAIKALQNTQ